MNVFIAEDSALVRERLIDLLSDLPDVAVVGWARSPAEAVEGIRDLTPDVVILDIHLSGGSGMDVLARIKRSGSPPTVVVLTNYVYPEYRKRCMELGADFFFDKSADFDRIPGVLDRLAKGLHDLPAEGGNCEK